MVAGPLILNERTELVPIDSIHPHERNVNQADLGAMIESIGVHAFYGTVIVQKSTGAILCGTHRWRAAHEKSYQQIPVTFIDVSDSQWWTIAFPAAPLLSESATQIADQGRPALGGPAALRGGGHTRANVQCAHFACNISKGVCGGDQMRVF